MPPTAPQTKTNTISYLLLGEGDFTYSLDMCRYLASLSEASAMAAATSSAEAPPLRNTTTAATADALPTATSTSTATDEAKETIYSITCTGVDTLSELTEKYKDVDFILRNIRQSSTMDTVHCDNNNIISNNYNSNVENNSSSIPQNNNKTTKNNEGNNDDQKDFIDNATQQSKQQQQQQKQKHQHQSQNARIKVTTKLLHGINAVDPNPNALCHTTTTTTINTNDIHDIHQEAPTTPLQLQQFDHVLFHHPHLGTEDAQLHSRFLQHFFYAAVHRWLKKPASIADGSGGGSGVGYNNEVSNEGTNGKNDESTNNHCSRKESHTNNYINNNRGGLLYLTLVTGQCQRWKCIEGANKQGLKLLRRGPFIVPPPPLEVTTSTITTPSLLTTTYYQPRRHQSGKSFAKRRRPTTTQQQPHQSHPQSNQCQSKKSLETSNEHHQNETSESETLVFGRVCDYPPSNDNGFYNDNDELLVGLLPWEEAQYCYDSQSFVSKGNGNHKIQTLDDSAMVHSSSNVDGAARDSAFISSSLSSSIAATAPTTTNTTLGQNHANYPRHALGCKYCSKSFQEDRSLKNHMVCCHPDCEEARAWNLEKKQKKRKKKGNKKISKEESKDGHAVLESIEKVGMDNEENELNSDSESLNKRRKLHQEIVAQQSDHKALIGKDVDVMIPLLICNICERQRKVALSSTSKQQQPSSLIMTDTLLPSQPRIFPHKQALLDHQRAKHFGDYLDIKPDWYREDGNNPQKDCIAAEKAHQKSPVLSPATFGSCPICDLSYSTETEKNYHEMEFVPSPAVAAAAISSPSASNELLNQSGSTHKCVHCWKTFRELRSQRQHENFCSSRLVTKKKTNDSPHTEDSR